MNNKKNIAKDPMSTLGNYPLLCHKNIINIITYSSAENIVYLCHIS